MQLVVCSVPRPVPLEGPEQTLGHERQHGPPRSKSASSARSASRSLRQHNQCAQLLVDQQKDGDSPVKMVVQGLQERNQLKRMYGLRMCACLRSRCGDSLRQKKNGHMRTRHARRCFSVLDGHESGRKCCLILLSCESLKPTPRRCLLVNCVSSGTAMCTRIVHAAIPALLS